MASFDVALGMPITAVAALGQAERFALYRLCLVNDAPKACKVERVRVALERLSKAVRTVGMVCEAQPRPELGSSGFCDPSLELP